MPLWSTITKTIKILVGGNLATDNNNNSMSATKSQCAPKIINKREISDCKRKNTKTCKRLREANFKMSVNENTCLTSAALSKLVMAYNKSNPRDKILILKNGDDQWREFSKKMPKNMAEIDWLDQDFVKSALTKSEIAKVKHDHYRPEAPDSWKQNSKTWLSTDDIDKCLQQYADKFSDFKYFGAVPSDFHLKLESGACAISDLCNINIKNLLAKKYKYVGAVFNFDTHDMSGSHWVAMFVNMPKREITYLDSNGLPPIPSIKQLMFSIKGQSDKLGMKFKIKYNKKRHQLENTECGTYAINFISQQVEGAKFEEIVSKIIRDKEMNSKRFMFFNV